MYPFLSAMQANFEPLNSPGVHDLSHQKIVSQAYLIRLPPNFHVELPEDYQWILSSEFEQMGKPVLLLNLITDNLVLKDLLDG